MSHSYIFPHLSIKSNTSQCTVLTGKWIFHLFQLLFIKTNPVSFYCSYLILTELPFCHCSDKSFIPFYGGSVGASKMQKHFFLCEALWISWGVPGHGGWGHIGDVHLGVLVSSRVSQCHRADSTIACLPLLAPSNSRAGGQDLWLCRGFCSMGHGQGMFQALFWLRHCPLAHQWQQGPRGNMFLTISTWTSSLDLWKGELSAAQPHSMG